LYILSDHYINILMDNEVHKGPLDDSDEDEVSALDLRDLYLEADAIKNGKTVTEEFVQRQKNLGNHIVTTGEIRPPSRFQRAIAWIIDSF
jgi:hypothetical protein